MTTPRQVGGAARAVLSSIEDCLPVCRTCIHKGGCQWLAESRGGRGARARGVAEEKSASSTSCPFYQEEERVLLQQGGTTVCSREKNYKGGRAEDRGGGPWVCDLGERCCNANKSAAEFHKRFAGKVVARRISRRGDPRGSVAFSSSSSSTVSNFSTASPTNGILAQHRLSLPTLLTGSTSSSPKLSARFFSSSPPSPTTSSSSPPPAPGTSIYKRAFPATRDLVPFSEPISQLKIAELISHNAATQFFELIQNFQQQALPPMCGPASIAMVLNSLCVDSGRVWRAPWRWTTEDTLVACVVEQPLCETRGSCGSVGGTSTRGGGSVGRGGGSGSSVEVTKSSSGATRGRFFSEGSSSRPAAQQSALSKRILRSRSPGGLSTATTVASPSALSRDSSEGSSEDDLLSEWRRQFATHTPLSTRRIAPTGLSASDGEDVSTKTNPHSFDKSTNPCRSFCRKKAAQLQDGMTMEEFAHIAESNALDVSVRYADTMTLDDFRSELRELFLPTTPAAGGGHDAAASVDYTTQQQAALFQSSTRLCVGFSRRTLGMTGDGHYSPVGAYWTPSLSSSQSHGQDQQQDMVLILDVAHFKYPPYWVSVPKLYEAMLEKDPQTGASRGCFLLTRRGQPATAGTGDSVGMGSAFGNAGGSGRAGGGHDGEDSGWWSPSGESFAFGDRSGDKSQGPGFWRNMPPPHVLFGSQHATFSTHAQSSCSSGTDASRGPSMPPPPSPQTNTPRCSVCATLPQPDSSTPSSHFFLPPPVASTKTDHWLPQKDEHAAGGATAHDEDLYRHPPTPRSTEDHPRNLDALLTNVLHNAHEDPRGWRAAP